MIPFARPDITDDEIAEVVDALRSGWLTTGPRAKQFEEDFAAYLGGGVEAVAVNSATAGLHLALEAAGVGPGDDVIVPSYTFTATAEVVRYLGADARIVDIDPNTLNIELSAIEAACTSRTKAIMPVHFAGLACDLESIIKFAKARGIAVIEDAAHAFPCRYRSRLVGTHDTKATVFSFYANKTITTGEGGMVVTRDAVLAKRCRIMRLHGIDRDVFNRFQGVGNSWAYEVVAPGFKYNLTDIAAALGIVQLRRADAMQAARERISLRYLEAFKDLPIELPVQAPSGDQHAWHLFIIRLDDTAKISRNEVIAELAKRQIGTSVHYIPLHRHPYWRDRYQLTDAMFPNATREFECAVSIPLYSAMSESEQQQVVDAVKAVLAR